MARRAKTKVGGGPRQDTMLAAGSRGRASVERAEAQQLQGIQRGGDTTAGAIREGLGGIGQAVQRRKAAGVEESRFQQQMDMQAADKGLVRDKPQQGGAPQDPGAADQSTQKPGEYGPAEDERSRQLRLDMDRGAKQTSKPIESTTGGYRKSEERLAGEEQAQEIATTKAQTAHLNAQTSLQRAMDKNDGSSEAEANVKAAGDRWMKQMDRDIETIDKLSTGKFNMDDMRDLFQEMKDNPDSSIQEAMGLGEEEIKSRPDLVARMIEAAKNSLGAKQIRKISVDGDLNGLDDRLPAMRQFREIRDQVSQFAQGNMGFAEMTQNAQGYIEDQAPGTQGGQDFANRYQGFRSRKEVTTFLNKTSAFIQIRRDQLQAASRQQQAEQGEQPEFSQQPQGGGNAAQPGAAPESQPAQQPAGPRQGFTPVKNRYGPVDISQHNQFGTKF